MGKFEIFLLLLGIGALAFFSQMPRGNVAIDDLPKGVSAPGMASPPVGTGGLGEYEGAAILARFSTDSFRVVDGDSIRIKTAGVGEVDLRLASIDAPELKQTGGRAAKRHLQSITAGRTATFLQTDTDRYQRPVVFMFVKGQQEVNALMVADGFAWHAIRFSSSDRLAQLEASAKAKRLGLWADPNPQPPWEYRDRK